jgi:hypothetical protein
MLSGALPSDALELVILLQCQSGAELGLRPFSLADTAAALRTA